MISRVSSSFNLGGRVGSALAGRVFATATTTAWIVAAVACGDDAQTGPTAQMKKFCQDMFASPTFACCTAADRQERHFAARYKYQSADDCATQLGQQSAQASGRQVFDATAATSCLSHLAGRTCGVIPNAATRAAEQKAGCDRILKGTQDENQPCNTNGDCLVGLICPPSPDTGVSSCAKPAAANQTCTGQVATVDHPPCVEGLVCQFVSENPVCPTPPCPVYQCVPLSDEGEACAGLECASGLSCRDKACSKAGLARVGEGCQISEHCAEGLFCDPAIGTCASRKAAGAECRSNANAIFECLGVCKNVGDGPGTCDSFCGG